MTRLALIISAESKQQLHARARATGKKEKFPTRVYHRCTLCGRRGGFMRFFGICRICFRELAVNGDVPGLKKSSW